MSDDGKYGKNPTEAESIKKIHMVHGLVDRKCYNISTYRGTLQTTALHDMWVLVFLLWNHGWRVQKSTEDWLLRPNVSHDPGYRPWAAVHDRRYKGHQLRHCGAVSTQQVPVYLWHLLAVTVNYPLIIRPYALWLPLTACKHSEIHYYVSNALITIASELGSMDNNN